MILTMKAKNKITKGGENKMRHVLSIFLILGFALCCISLAEAQTSTTISATATVQQELYLLVSLNRINSMGTETYTDDVWDTTPATAMTFGTLTHTLDNGQEAGTLFSKPYYYVALMGAFTSGRRYYIRSSCSGLVGPTTITQGFGVTYLDGDPKKADGTTSINTGPMASGAVLGTPGPAAVTNKLLFDSGSTGAHRVIGVYFGIPPYKSDGSIPYSGYQPIPISTVNGDYSGSVLFTLTLY